MSRKQLDLCTENAEEPLFRNDLANGTPACIVALVTIERIVKRSDLIVPSNRLKFSVTTGALPSTVIGSPAAVGHCGCCPTTAWVPTNRYSSEASCKRNSISNDTGQFLRGGLPADTTRSLAYDF